MNRQSKWVFALLAISLGLSWYFTRQGPEGPNPRAECLSDAQCESTERCVVVPKGDGFATFGQCGEVCSDDTSCPNGWVCREWLEDEGHLSPARGKEGRRVMACVHHLVQ